MRKATVLPEAADDIRQARQWYEDRSPGLGARFTADLRDRVMFIRRNPHATAIRYDDVRTTPLRSFPYMVHYSIGGADGEIIIAAVFHTSADPKRWGR